MHNPLGVINRSSLNTTSIFRISFHLLGAVFTALLFLVFYHIFAALASGIISSLRIQDIDTILSETRMALDKAGIQDPYVLCPHSLSGLEALYWAQKYPDEVEAIVGLDMAVPAYYDEMDISIPMMKLGHYGAALGITRWIPSLAESDAIKYGTLSEKEKEIYRAVFYQRTATETMIDEAKVVKDNANIVNENGIPQVPMLLFISNGSGGTSFTKENWRSIPEKYISDHDNVSYIELDCPHYVHDYKYEEISQEIRNFIQ